MKVAVPRVVPPSMTLARTVASPTTFGVWNVRAIPSDTRVLGEPNGICRSPSQ